MFKEYQFNKPILRMELIEDVTAQNYAKHLEKIFTDLKSTPHFNDEEVVFEDTGISFFHKESKNEIEWAIVVNLQIFINLFGFKVSHILENEDFKVFAQMQEAECLGESFHLVKSDIGPIKLIPNDKEN